MGMILALYEMYVSQKKKDKEGNKTSHRLFLSHAILMLCRAKKSRLIDHFQIVHFRTHQEKPKKEIPEFAFDKHTRKGKKNGNGIEHFFEVGAVLENVGDVEKEAEYYEKCYQILKQEEELPKTSPPKTLLF